jgi:hypothetical protein
MQNELAKDIKKVTVPPVPLYLFLRIRQFNKKIRQGAALPSCFEERTANLDTKPAVVPHLYKSD